MRYAIYNCGCTQSRKHLKLIVKLGNKPQRYRYLTDNVIQRNKLKDKRADPILLTKHHLDTLHDNIKKVLSTRIIDLQKCSQYYFDNQGKFVRPMTILLMGKACNASLHGDSMLNSSQKKMAMIAEMIHTSSLLHDDVIDDAVTRRNKPSVNQIFTQKEAILAGDYILSKASILLAQLKSTEAVCNFSQIINDLVKGELMQLIPRTNTEERFNHYIQKTFRKTASLIAYSCKSVALLGNSSETVQNAAFNYGKNMGIAFQLIDDALDFTSSSEAMGKETSADLSLGLATAPVLFAAEKYPDLNALIGRRFKDRGDIQRAVELVSKSDGIKETYILAQKYTDEATKDINVLNDSIEKEGLINLCKYVIDRKR